MWDYFVMRGNHGSIGALALLMLAGLGLVSLGVLSVDDCRAYPCEGASILAQNSTILENDISSSELHDTTPPIIVLNGPNPINLRLHDAYVEYGAKAIDDRDGDISHLISIDGDVRTNDSGMYELHYRVRDKAGNVALARRTVVVHMLNSESQDNSASATADESDTSTEGLNQKVDEQHDVPIEDISEEAQSDVNSVIQTETVFETKQKSLSRPPDELGGRAKLHLDIANWPVSNPQLSGTVLVTVNAPNASAVRLELYSFLDDNFDNLGHAVRTETGIWRYMFDTTPYPTGKYVLTARTVQNSQEVVGDALTIGIRNTATVISRVSPATNAEKPNNSAPLLKNDTTITPRTLLQATSTVPLYDFEYGPKRAEIVSEETDQENFLDRQTGGPQTQARTAQEKIQDLVQNPLGLPVRQCKTRDACLALCITSDNRDQCRSFIAEQIDKDPKVRSVIDFVDPDIFQQVVSDTSGPGGCTTHQQCASYCSNPTHDEECQVFALTSLSESTEAVREKVTVISQSRQKIKDTLDERTGARKYIDMDGDGITDFDEVNLYGTNPTLDDTDGDGTLDGDELITRRNPLKQTDDRHVDEDVRNAGLYIEDVGQVQNILLTDAKRVQLSGIGPANSFITIFIYSEPIVVTVRVDERGLWEYELDRELPDGNHEVITAVTNIRGEVLARGPSVPLVKEAGAATLGTAIAPPQSDAPGFFSVFAGLSALAVLLGILMILIGIIGFMNQGKNNPASHA